ncbi:toxic anion resistance protein [Lonsdalea quercina]|uniref:toxic anion resistance protein n=1 Tax=Lonsdalea quercina TaxID=71657 RepID=UPI0039748DA5
MTGAENIEVPTKERLKDGILPTLFSDANAISRYGESEISSNAMDRYSSLMEKSAVSALSGSISQIVNALAEADPRTIARKPSWFSRFSGTHLEKQVRYQKARMNVEALIGEGKSFMEHVYEMLHALEDLMMIHHQEIERLKVFIEAGREFLCEEPEETKADDLNIVFDKPRERFARKIANLATLLASHEMSVTQMKITRAQCIDILDRFNETVNVLVPVWRQHTLSLLTTTKIDPDMVSKATQAHQALMKSLHKSLEGIE